MNKMKKRILACLNALVIMLSLFGTIPAFAAEEEQAETALAYVAGYEVSGKSVTPGNAFILTLTLKNYSSTAPAENVMVTIANPSGVAPEYGTVSTSYVGTIAAGSTKKLSLKYSSNSNVSEDELKFSVNVVCDGGTTGTEVRVPVGEKARVFVSGYRASGHPVVPGDDFTLTVTLKNYSMDSAADNVIVTLNNPTGIVPRYGTVCVAQVDSIKANGTAEVTFHLSSDKNLSASNLNFTVGVVCDTSSTSTQISVPVMEKPEVCVTGYEVTKERIVPGENFTVTLSVKNLSKSAAAKNIQVSISNPSGAIPERGAVNIRQIASIAPDATEKVSFAFSAASNLVANRMDFTVQITSDSGSSSMQFSIPVGEPAEVGVIGYEVTKEPVVPGDDFTITLLVRNHSKDAAAKNVTVTMSNPSGVVPESGTVNTARIESIAPNTTEKVAFTFSATADLIANELYFTSVVTCDSGTSSMQLSIPVRKIAQLYVVGYEVTNETIIPGNDFALKVQVKNQSADVTVRDAVVVITNPSGVIPEYGKVGTALIESMAPGSTEEICLRYSSDSDIKTTELNFTVGVFYDNLSTSAQIRIPVGKMTDFAVEKSSMPEKMVVGTVGYASAMVENLEETGVSNVVMVARCNGNDIASANIGTISAKTYKTQSVSLMFEQEGQYAVDLLLTYTNGAGENKEYTISSSIIQVVAEEKMTDNADGANAIPADKQENEPEKGISNLLLFSISGVLLIGLCCVILILLYRRKK